MSAGHELNRKDSEPESLDELKFFEENEDIEPMNTLDMQQEPIQDVIASWGII